jgi:hypothetical protein
LPEILLFDRSKVARLKISQIERGIDPVRWLSLRVLGNTKQEKPL